MSDKEEVARADLSRLIDALVRDLLATGDDDITAEFRESDGDPEKHSADMLARFEQTVISANKHRLAAARAAVAADSRRSHPIDGGYTQPSKARAQLRAILDAPRFAERLTFAARKESEMSDEDVLSLLADLEELGVLPPDNGGDGAGK